MYPDTATPAFVSALHVALAMIRRHRAAGRSALSPFVLPSLLAAVTPWIWPDWTALGVGVAAHLAWLGLCEVIAPAHRTTRRPTAPAPAPAPLTVPARAATTFVPTTVLAVLDETPEIKTFRLHRPEGFTFQAGQFVAVRVQIDGRPHVRCYSISSAPETPGYLEISVRRQGVVSGALHATVRAGSTLIVNRPAGQFVYPESDDRPLVLLAGGIGITPLLSMLRHATAAAPTRPVTLLYSARTEHDVAFHNDLRVLAERHPQIRIAITLTRPTAPTRFRYGRLDAGMVRQYVPAPADSVYCLCGPDDMIAGIRALLAEIGVPDGQIRYERFDTAVAATQLQTPAPVTQTAGARPSVRVTFASSGLTTTSPSVRTLLETAEDIGVHISSLCRAGVCQSCRTRLTSGDADCRSDVLDPDDRAAGYVLPCVTHPLGDCVLEA